MALNRISMLFSLGKKSAQLLFSCSTRRYVTPGRSGTQRTFHSSSYMRSAKKSSTPLLTTAQKLSAPPLRRLRNFLIPTAVFGGIGAGLLFMHFNDEKRAIRQGQCKNDGCSSRNGPVIGGPFKLIDSNGNLATEKDLKGNWILLYFGYTSSPDVGPAELQKLTKAIKTLTSSDLKRNIKVQPVFVTLDPQRDTPSHLRAYLKEKWHMSTEFSKKLKRDGDDYLCRILQHNMYLMNPNMEIVRTFGLEYNAEQLTQEIRKELQKITSH
ncbi:Copper chaperone SCO1/SenC [Artemisia annua]|uniref:Copper chaperone SCO1/SenC n=1 Tax=Artemisia annua TaxID=35608 RepID=A0A2U1KX02_ARTAN|nr:Copper chaperone SCO1/SenC [Artemisia annua]